MSNVQELLHSEPNPVLKTELRNNMKILRQDAQLSNLS